MTERLRFFAPCPPGVEPLLADELRRLGLRGVRPQRSGVLFAGTVADGQRAVYWTRLASRVLLTLAEVDASSTVALYEGVRELPWEEHVRADGTISVDAGGTNDSLRNTQFTAVRVKDAVADRFRDKCGTRPSVDGRAPDLRINVAVRARTATISIDLAGEPLHRRGYREAGLQVEAPMKETLAATVLEVAGWREIAERGGAFADPMCGSGTLAIEAALVAANIAPGLLREGHPIERWLGFDAEAWQRQVVSAERRRAEGLERLPVILASDSDPRAVDIAKRFVARAGLDGYVRVERKELEGFVPPPGANSGLIATNPPWGERLSDRAELPALYAVLASTFEALAGWRLAVVSPDPDLSTHLHLNPAGIHALGTGKGAATVTVFEIGKASMPAETGDKRPGSGRTAREAREQREARRPDKAAVTSATIAASTADPAAVRETVKGAAEFANRLGKMAKHYGKWAQRAGVTCYRIYDADLPDFSFAVDLYQGAGPDEGKRWVHMAEYAAPAYIDAERASARLEAAAALVPEILGVAAEDVFVKRRERQRGSTQYVKQSRQGVKGVVAENGLLFEVNLSDYLDTGLFLDHRDTRAWIRELAAGTRFLNLFAYTGSATVYAAAGGAAQSTTVDLSATYTAWAGRNMALNGFETPEHVRVQADTLAWLEEAAGQRERFDLVFCDPPTFSNSKRMDGTWDVQRDHVVLLTAVNDVLADDGVIVFSCNRRGFTLDEAGLAEAGLTAKDVAARTIPKDFESTPGIHSCWRIERA
ncbi:MAG TPA: bifunctional 23S rRNA (guanine(2069)-N(7))-methyltransferase RlmK/23S rRNA (guanine(2445)-N(2))-methyltransferase RlmL [Coriobacteriia bacterium]|nr:bifunctional 23S rRNA (guanine(2069)-N(7))-methyltransferase RlmK/23S rRNA (guanine(2445)-N(2))-methyltransferase RlmL [Coriobacteriia bacterium]